ncbi:MAG: universal stress protein [Sediminibacterium sp.]|nr:universal stress protein [Sediminibacterium sp.]MDP3666703.1 universal stress protein [Sediminibacterium sp.]
MKKIIAAFDGLKYSESTRDYAIYMAKQTNTHLVGVFMDDRIYNSYKVYELMVKNGKPGNNMKKLEAKDKATRDAAAQNFEKACQKEGLEYTIHHDHNIAINELKHESIYADLLIIDPRETLTHYTEKLPTRFIRDLLNDAQCPVLLVPQKKYPFQKVILLYDGEPSSVHAIKMYSYLLPELKDLDTEVISVNPPTTTLHMPDNKLMKEFMKRHHPKAKYTILKGLAEDEIIKHLKKSQDNALVVLGTLRRGTVSRWFRENMADILMREVALPLFIVHDK